MRSKEELRRRESSSSGARAFTRRTKLQRFVFLRLPRSFVTIGDVYRGKRVN